MIKQSIVLTCALFGALALAQPTGAQEGSKPPELTSQEKAAIEAARPELTNGKSVKVICKTRPEPGTRLGGRRICQTKAQWDEANRDARQRLERTQSQLAPPILHN